jgi:hypothetical protein
MKKHANTLIVVPYDPNWTIELYKLCCQGGFEGGAYN